MEDEILPEVYTNSGAKYKQEVQYDILFNSSFKQKAGNKEAVVYIKHDKERYWHCTAMTQVVYPANRESTAVHQQKWKGKNNAPSDDMNEDFYNPACFGFLHNHITKIIILMKNEE
jgi:hypothetical protein